MKPVFRKFFRAGAFQVYLTIRGSAVSEELFKDFDTTKIEELIKKEIKKKVKSSKELIAEVNNLLDVLSKTGFPIKLTRTQWKWIREGTVRPRPLLGALAYKKYKPVYKNQISYRTFVRLLKTSEHSIEKILEQFGEEL